MLVMSNATDEGRVIFKKGKLFNKVAEKGLQLVSLGG